MCVYVCGEYMCRYWFNISFSVSPPPLIQAQGTLSKIRDQQYWASVVDRGSTLRQPWLNGLCLLNFYEFTVTQYLPPCIVMLTVWQMSLLDCFISISCLDFGGRVTYKSVVLTIYTRKFNFRCNDILHVAVQ